MAVDSAGDVYVADRTNHRVLGYPSPLTTDIVADVVFGQSGSFSSMTSNLGGVGASSLSSPHAVAVSGSGNLYVGDTGNNRALVYNPGLIPDTVQVE